MRLKTACAGGLITELLGLLQLRRLKCVCLLKYLLFRTLDAQNTLMHRIVGKAEVQIPELLQPGMEERQGEELSSVQNQFAIITLV